MISPCLCIAGPAATVPDGIRGSRQPRLGRSRRAANTTTLPTGSNVNTAMLDALAVPHPELVAGTPDSYG